MQSFATTTQTGKTSTAGSYSVVKKWFLILPILLAGILFSTHSNAQFSNVPVTGFNADIVADGTTNPDASTSSTTGVDGAGWVFVTSSFYPSAVGVPCSAAAFPGPTITSTNATNNTGITYTIQPETGNNALSLVSAGIGDLTLTTPISAAKLFLVCLSGDGACAFSAKINFSDGTNETVTSTAPDWCGGAATYKLTPTEYYRIRRTAIACDGALCPYIYEVPITISAANYTKIINSITLTNNSVGSKLNVLAVGRRDGFAPGLVYTVNGNASQDDCHTYTLTNANAGQSGSVWNNIQLDLSASFDFLFDVYLGATDVNGADGIAFVLQPISTSIGGTGSGLGFGGISPSIGITMDTYQNSLPDSDPAFDHISIQRNGDLDHLTANNLAGPVQIVNGNDNAEDAAWHKLRIVWDATTKTLTASIDGVVRVTHTEDIVATTFSGNPNVYWGFTGSTGALFNLQRFKTTLEPHWHFGPTQTLCVNQPITFNDSTVSFTTIAKIIWDFGDGSNLDSVNTNPTHTYTAAGTYTVIQTVRGADGCIETNTQIVIVGGSISLSSNVTDANCTTQGIVVLTLPATPAPFTVTWNSTPVQNGTTVNLDPGNYTATVIDGAGCSSTHDVTVDLVNDLVLTLHVDTTICTGSSFNANTTSNGTTFSWTPTAGVSDPTQASPVLTPTVTTTYTVDAGLQFCTQSGSFTVTVPVVTADAGPDVTITAGTSTTLQGNASTGTYSWSPSTGLSSTTALNPTANPLDTTTYTLTVTSPDGCIETDQVTVNVKPVADCAVPMEAISPNGDGINDAWQVGTPTCFLRAAVHIYNRYGSLVYENKDYKNDWKGTYKLKPCPDGTYYFVIEFTLNDGRTRVQRGNVTIIR